MVHDVLTGTVSVETLDVEIEIILVFSRVSISITGKYCIVVLILHHVMCINQWDLVFYSGGFNTIQY